MKAVLIITLAAAAILSGCASTSSVYELPKKASVFDIDPPNAKEPIWVPIAHKDVYPHIYMDMANTRIVNFAPYADWRIHSVDGVIQGYAQVSWQTCKRGKGKFRYRGEVYEMRSGNDVFSVIARETCKASTK